MYWPNRRSAADRPPITLEGGPWNCRSAGTAALLGREPQDLPVDFQGRLLGEPPEHTHEGDLVREAQPIVGAPPQGDLSSVGLEHAQQIAGHASPRTTKLYDRTADTVTLEEIERIVI